MVKKENKVKLRSEFMTLRPLQKIKRKNKRTQLQVLYDAGKVRSEEFYKELNTFIKWRLMTDLIRRGYYINGVKQNSFTRDECDACYIHVLRRILDRYDSKKGTLATFVRWQIRGWGQLVIQKQVRAHKYIPHGMLSLDTDKTSNIKIEYEQGNLKNPEDTEIYLDYKYYGNSALSNITRDDIDKVRKGIEELKVVGEKEIDWAES